MDKDFRVTMIDISLDLIDSLIVDYLENQPCLFVDITFILDRCRALVQAKTIQDLRCKYKLKYINTHKNNLNNNIKLNYKNEYIKNHFLQEIKQLIQDNICYSNSCELQTENPFIYDGKQEIIISHESTIIDMTKIEKVDSNYHE